MAKDQNFEDFAVTRHDDIDNAAYTLGVTLTSKRNIFTAPDFLMKSNISKEEFELMLEDHSTSWIPSVSLLREIVDGAITAIRDGGCEIIAENPYSYLNLWAASELADIMYNVNSNAGKFSLIKFDEDAAEENFEWDMEILGGIEDSAEDSLRDVGCLICIPYSDDKETPCYKCAVSDCARRVHMQCPLIASNGEPVEAKQDIPTIAQRDAELEKLWDKLADIPFDEREEDGELILAEPWNEFAVGTSREEIWHWFDERHSEGVAYLLYGRKPDEEHTKELIRRDKLCFECDAEHCVFNPRGICCFPMVYGVEPKWSDDGCEDMVYSKDNFEE